MGVAELQSLKKIQGGFTPVAVDSQRIQSILVVSQAEVQEADTHSQLLLHGKVLALNGVVNVNFEVTPRLLEST